MLHIGAERSDIGGTGIGLEIGKQIVEMMASEIGFESRVGAGSDFWVELPRARLAMTQAETLIRLAA